jgi:CheY-like chemotaxis protein
MYNLGMNRRILIVDDTKAWLMFHRELITQLYGNTFEITTASSAAEALDIVRHNIRNPFSLILSDLQMEMDYEPLLAGEWFVENVQQIRAYSRTNIVLISSMSNIEYIAQKYGVECVSKSLLIYNKLAMKYMFEKLMQFLTKM